MATRTERRWKAQPRACAGGSASRRGPTCGRLPAHPTGGGRHRPGPLILRDVRLPRHRQPLPGSYEDVIEMLSKRFIRFSFQLTLGIALEVLIEMAS